LQILLNSSIYNDKYNTLFSEYKAKYQIELSESKIKNLENERTALSETLYNERIITFLLFLLALSTTFILVIFITSRKKINSVINELNIRNKTLLDQKNELQILHSELSQKESNLRNAQEIAKLANWEWNKEGDKFSFSDQMSQIFGITKEELTNNFRNSILSVVHPDDRDIVGTYLHQGRNKREYHDREYRIICSSSIKWIRSKYSALTDENGELIQINGTVQDITSLKEEEEIRLTAATQRSFTSLLILSQEQERKRIAGELHDSFGQDLLFIKNKMKLGLRDKNIEQVAGSFISEIDKSVDTMLALTRDIAYSLIPVHLERLGLAETLIELVNRASKTSIVQFNLDVESINNVFPVEKELTIYRIVQEGLNNIIKHSSANNASIIISKRKKVYLLEIDDDGIGFDLSNSSTIYGFGLANISNRVNLLNGKIKIISKPGVGTNLKIFIPVGEKIE
jgi:PAS domain S-box-containing protein